MAGDENVAAHEPEEGHDPDTCPRCRKRRAILEVGDRHLKAMREELAQFVDKPGDAPEDDDRWEPALVALVAVPEDDGGYIGGMTTSVPGVSEQEADNFITQMLVQTLLQHAPPMPLGMLQFGGAAPDPLVDADIPQAG